MDHIISACCHNINYNLFYKYTLLINKHFLNENKTRGIIQIMLFSLNVI